MEKNKPTGPRPPLEFEAHIVNQFRTAVTEQREHLGRKMAALMKVKDDIQTARINGWKYSGIAHKLSQGIVTVDAATVARFCREHLGEKPSKKSGKKGGRGSTAASTPPASTPASGATETETKPTGDIDVSSTPTSEATETAANPSGDVEVSSDPASEATETEAHPTGDIEELP